MLPVMVGKWERPAWDGGDLTPDRGTTNQNGMNASNSVDINGDKIRRLREQKELTQLYLATVVGVTTDTISRWENRRYPSVKLDNARKLAEALGIDLEELLDGPAEIAPAASAEPSEQVAATRQDIPASSAAPFSRNTWRMATFGGLAIVCLAVVSFLLVGLRSGVRATRILPPHTAPNVPFPVLVYASGEAETNGTLLIREELEGECEAFGPVVEGEAKPYAKNPRWIGKLEDGKAVFLYLVQPGKKLKNNEEIRFSGDTIVREGQTTGNAIGGANRIVIALYHWADTDRDSVISDSEILKAYETFSGPGENLVNFTAIEELWLAGRYGWNKKTMTFVPAYRGEGKD